MTRFLVFLLAVTVGIGSAVAGPYKGMIAGELSLQSVKSETVPSIKKVPRSKCSFCKGTGKIDAGDGVVHVLRECEHCYPDKNRTGDEPPAASCPEPDAPKDMKPTPAEAPLPGIKERVMGWIAEIPELPEPPKPAADSEINPPAPDPPKEVKNLVTYEYWHAVWCGPCKKIDPVIAAHPQGVTVYDYDSNVPYGNQVGITAIPVIIKRVNGVEVGRLLGGQPPQKVKEFLGVRGP